MTAKFKAFCGGRLARRVGGACALLFVVWSTSVAAAERSEVVSTAGEARVGEVAPWFALWNDAGAVVNRTALSRDERAGTILVFFATWCEPCIAGMDQLRAAQETLDAAGVRVLLVNLDDDAATARSWLAARRYRWPWVHDRFRTTASAFGVLAAEDAAGTLRLPFTAAIDRNEVIRRLVRTEGDDYVALLLASFDSPNE